MPNFKTGPGEAVAGAIAGASAELFVARASEPLSTLPDPERTQEIARIVGGEVTYLLANSPTLAGKPVHNPIVIRAGGTA